jgi:stage II sporulation protein M
VAAGYWWFSANSAHLVATASPEEISQAMALGVGTPRGIKIPFQFILGHNLQAIAVLMLLGFFSFGVLGMVSYIGNMGLIGGVLGLVKALGYSPAHVALTGILPHGIFELPALILSSAAVLHIGVALVTPAPHRTLGEVLIEALADWAKVNLGLVLPLLVVAAGVEAWITPVLLLSVLK